MCQAWVRVCCFSSGFLSDVWAMLGTETLIVRFLYLWYFIHQNKSLMSVVVRGSLRRSLSRRRKTSLAKTLDLKKKADPVQQFFFGSECFVLRGTHFLRFFFISTKMYTNKTSNNRWFHWWYFERRFFYFHIC